MECFNTVLLKLREVHEREVEGWQVKIQELSNKKGCESKRMEELFSKNQQMKVQQGLLTENIRTLENRLRAGLCDRCTVTQEVAKKRQQEFEASHIQSIQHISVLMTELTNLKRENNRLREEMGNYRAALKGHNNDHSSNSSTTTEVKANSSPAISPSSRPEALVAAATSRAFRHPADGDVAVKSEADRRTEEAEHRQWSGMNRSHYAPLSQESNKLLLSTPWKTEHGVTRGDKRARSVEGLTQLSTIPPQALLLKNVSSITGGEVNRSRHVLHAPVPCRPQAIKSSPVTLPWPLSESSEWGAAAAAAAAAASGTSQVVPPSLKYHPPPRYPNLIPTGQHASPMRQVLGSLWNKQGPPRHPAKEPTVLFRLRGMLEHEEAHTKPQETQTQKEIPPTKAEKVSGEGLRDASDGPLDLSDHGKSKSSQMPRDYSPSALRAVDRVQSSPDNNAKTSPSSHVPVSSPSPALPPSSSTTPAVKYQEVEPIRDHNHEVMLGPLSYKMNRQRRWADGKEEVKRIQGTMFSSQQVITEQEEHEEVNGKTEQSDEKKVPVLTISLRPVLLESLNSALKKQESLSSNGKSPVADTESSSEEQGDQGKEECESGQESNQSSKRKRASVEMETDRDSDTENVQRERKIKITARTEEKSPS